MLDPLPIPHRPGYVAYLTRDASSERPTIRVRSAPQERLAEVWTLLDECAIRSLGLMEGRTARQQWPVSEWALIGDQLHLYVRELHRHEHPLVLVFERAEPTA